MLIYIAMVSKHSVLSAWNFQGRRESSVELKPTNQGGSKSTKYISRSSGENVCIVVELLERAESSIAIHADEIRERVRGYLVVSPTVGSCRFDH